MDKDHRIARPIFTGERAVILIVAALVGVVHLWGAYGLGLVSYSTPGAGLFPLLSALLVIAMAAVSLFELWSGGPVEDAPVANWPRLLHYALAMLLWALSFSYLGFVISSAVSIFLLMLLAERQSLLKSVTMTAVSVAVSWLFFQKMLSVPLPPGVLFR